MFLLYYYMNNFGMIYSASKQMHKCIYYLYMHTYE